MKLINKTMYTFFFASFSMAAVYRYREAGHLLCSFVRIEMKRVVTRLLWDLHGSLYANMKYLLPSIWKVLIIFILKYLLSYLTGHMMNYDYSVMMLLTWEF